MQTISITHQEDKTVHRFKVRNADRLSPAEVARICKKMGVTALLINGKYYETSGNLGGYASLKKQKPRRK